MSNHPTDITVNVSMQLDQSVTVVFADINKRVAEQQRKMTAAYTKGFADLAKQQKRSADAAIKLNKSVADFKIAADKRAANEAAKAAEKESQRKTALIAKEAQERRDAIQKSVREHEQALAKQAAANRAVTDGLVQASESVVKLSRGFAALGVVSDENAKKILEVTNQVEAAIEVAKGAIGVYRGVAGAVAAYRTSVAAAAAAEKALGKARAATAAAGGVGKVIGGVSGAAGLAGGAAGATGLASAAAAAAPIAAVIAGLAALAAAIVLATESITGATGPGSASNAVGGFLARTSTSLDRNTRGGFGGVLADTALKTVVPLGGLLPNGSANRLLRATGMSAADSEIAAEKRAKKAAREREKNIRIDRLGRSELGATRQRIAIRDSAEQGVLQVNDTKQAQLDRSDARLSQVQQDRAGFRGVEQGAKTDGLKNEARQDIIKTLEKERGIISQQFNLVKQISAEKIAGVQRAIAGEQQQLEISQQRIDQLKESLRSGAQRFARASKEDREDAIEIQRKLLNNEYVNAEGRTKAERFGLSNTFEATAKLDQADAKEYGYFDNFGGAEQRRLEDERRKQEAIKASIEVNQKIEVDVKIDTEEVLTQLAEATDKALKEQATLLKADLQGTLDKMQGDNNNGNEARERGFSHPL